jgi:4-amino-4-deoxy-L-arabinose transferase-like glycosyltransferase
LVLKFLLPRKSRRGYDVGMKLPHRALFIALACATVVKLYLAYVTTGSLDVPGFYDHLQKIQELGVGAYRVRGAFNNPFNHPPPMIHLFRLWGWLTDTTALPFRFWVRLPSILADVGSFILVARLLSKLWPEKKQFSVLLALALCPTAILISGYHGNTDSLMIFFVLLSIYLIETGRWAWLAGLAFGLSVCVKVVPLVFAPAFFFYLRGWRQRIGFFGAALLTFVLCSLPYLAQDPRGIVSVVFGYASIYGNWGWSLIAALTFPEIPTYLHKPYDVLGSHAVFAQILKFIIIALSGAAAVWFNRRPLKPSLFLQCGFITAIVLFMTPGFGTQYLVWLLPFVAVLDLRTALLYYTTSTIYVARGFVCVAFAACLPPLLWLLVSLVCWLSIFAIVLAYRHTLACSTLPRQRASSAR